MDELAEQAPMAAFPSPSRGAPPSVLIWETVAFGAVSAIKKIGASWAPHVVRLLWKIKKYNFGAPLAPQMVLKLRQDHEDSEYVLSFEIRQWERCLYSGRTDRHTDRITEPPSTVFRYRLCYE